MKKRAAAILMLLGYSVPYAFLAMYGDAQLRTMWLYLPLLAGMTLLCLAAVRYRRPAALLIGNAWSFLSSCLLMAQLETEQWMWYFKPFSALGFMVTVSLIALSAQLLAYFLGVRRARKRMEPLR